MPEAHIAIPPSLPSKARVLAASLADFLVVLILPTAIYALLAPTGLSAVVRLTVGGFFVAAKASAGRMQEEFGRAILPGLLLAAACTTVTVATVYAGGTDGRAIGLGTGLFVVAECVSLFRTRRPWDAFALLVLVELAAAIILTSISNDARFVLLRPSFYTAIAGIYALCTVRSPRPLMMQASKPMAAAGNPVRAEAFERAGRESLRFRRTQQAMTIGLAMVLLAEATLRVGIVLSHPASSVLAASLWSHAASIGIFVAYFVVIKLVFVPRARREVDALMPRQ